MFGVLRFRRSLPLVPAVAALVLIAMPGVSERLLQGFGGRQGAIEVASDEYEITSGRNVIWPSVLDEIEKAPMLGYGRLAMNRLGVAQYLLQELNEDFPHPHNAYLEMLLDNGAVGLALVIPFYLVVLWRAVALFSNRSDDLSAAVGGLTLALVLALLIAAVGSQTFYPREGSVGMWAAIGIMLRVWEERKKGETSLLRVTAPASKVRRASSPSFAPRFTIGTRNRPEWTAPNAAPRSKLRPAGVPNGRLGKPSFRLERRSK